MNARSKRDEVRRKALVAATSVVLAFHASACDPVGSAGKPDPADPDAGDTDPGRVVDSDGATPDTDGVVADSDSDVASDSDSDVLAGDSGVDKPDCLEAALDLVACCDALHAWCGTAFAVDTEAYSECVFGPGFDGSTGCIPWGPPVPPAARLA